MPCYRFRVPRRKRWEVMLMSYGGDPRVEGRDSDNPKFREWMKRFGNEKIYAMPRPVLLADTMIESVEMNVCGNIHIEMCGFGHCEYAADYLCDWPIGEGKTCDLPICNQHAVQQRHEIHFCPVHQAMFVEKAKQPVSGGNILESVHD
jgi:hypothetical protein